MGLGPVLQLAMLDPPAPGEAAIRGQRALQVDARVWHLHVIANRLPIFGHQAEGCSWDLRVEQTSGLRSWHGAQKPRRKVKTSPSSPTGSPKGTVCLSFHRTQRIPPSPSVGLEDLSVTTASLTLRPWGTSKANSTCSLECHSTTLKAFLLEGGARCTGFWDSAGQECTCPPYLAADASGDVSHFDPVELPDVQVFTIERLYLDFHT